MRQLPGNAERQPERAVRSVAPAPGADTLQPGANSTGPAGLGAAEIRRLAATIIEAAEDVGSPQRAGALPASSAAPVRVVSLTLNPEHLGRVSVTIRLVGDRLSLRMDAEREETARMIEGDGEALARLLDSEGYGVDSLTATATAARDLAAPAPAATGTGSAPSFAPDPGAGSERQPSRQASDDGRPPSRTHQLQENETPSDEEVPPPAGRVGRIYV
jgi:chemotaxis protein MotD